MLFVFIAIFLSAFLYNYVFKPPKSEKYISVFNAFTLIIIASAKSIDRSPVDDIINYKNLFLNSRFLSYSKILNDGLNEELKDPFFTMFAKFFNELGFSVEMWMGIIAIVFAVCFSYLTFKHSKNSWLSLVVLFALHFSFTLTGLRQTMALAFICLAFHCILSKKPIKFTLFVLIACLFHSSAIICLPAYLIAKQKINFKQVIYIVGFFIAANFAPGIIRNIIAEVAWNEQMEYYIDRTVALSWSGFIIELLILIFCLFVRNNISEENIVDKEKIDMLINCLTISVCFLSVSTVVAEAFRISLYYSIANTILIPNIIQLDINIKQKRLWSFIIPLMLLAYIVWTSAYSTFVFFA